MKKNSIKSKKSNILLIILLTVIQVIVYYIIEAFLVERDVFHILFIIAILLWIPLFKLLKKNYLMYCLIFSISIIFTSIGIFYQLTWKYDYLFLFLLIVIIPLFIGVLFDKNKKKLFSNNIRKLVICLFIIIVGGVLLLPTSYNRSLASIIHKDKKIKSFMVYSEYVDQYNKKVSFFERKNYFHKFTDKELSKVTELSLMKKRFKEEVDLRNDNLLNIYIWGCYFDNLIIPKNLHYIGLSEINTLIIDTDSSIQYVFSNINETYIKVVKTNNVTIDFSKLADDGIYIVRNKGEKIYIDKNKSANDIKLENAKVKVYDENKKEKNINDYLKKGDILKFYKDDKNILTLTIKINE